MKPIRHYIVPVLMLFFTLLLALWMVMAKFSRQPFQPYYMTRDDIVEFQPALDGYTIQLSPYVRTVTEANIAMYSVVHDSSQSINQTATPSRFRVRLVHGYNMPMCMKMKYYTVEKIQDHQVRTVTDPKLKTAFRTIKSISREDAKHAKEGGSGYAKGGDDPSSLRTLRDSVQVPDSNLKESIPIPSDYPLPAQLWKITSSAGTVGYWVTTMIRADDFEPTTEDICSMAFPRVDMPDDPNWVPRGFTKDDLKHPVAAARRWFRGRWDASRWDLLTFLKLRQPAWPSDELFSYLTIIDDLPSGEIRADDVRRLLEVHEAMLKEMQAWRKAGGGMKRDEGGGER